MKKTSQKKQGDFCTLCGQRSEDGYTFIEKDKKHDLMLCESCRRLTLVKLFEQYMLEADMQKLINEMLFVEIDNIKKMLTEAK